MASARDDKALAAEGKETASDSESDMDWFSQSEGDQDCMSEDDSDDEGGSKAVIGSAPVFGNSGATSVLFETPSGFAIFGYYGINLLEPDAWKHIWADLVSTPKQAVWLKGFRHFEDKSRAIDKNTISPELVDMIKKHTRGQTLAVGEKDYADVISSNLRINCLCSPSVEELMWGLKIQMPDLLSEENSELTTMDHFPMCKGMEFLLNSHNFDVKPNMMVTKRIIDKAAIVYDCDRCVEKHQLSLRRAAVHLSKISRIRTQHWDLLKLATALKFVCEPEEEIAAPRRLFGKSQLMKLKRDAPKYESKILKTPCLEVYNEIYTARKIRSEAAGSLIRLLKRAEMAPERAGEASGHEIGPGSKNIIHGIPTMIDVLMECHTTLSAKRKTRQVPRTLALVDEVKRYAHISSHPLNRLNEPGILSLDIHPSKDIVATGGMDTNAVLFDRPSGEILCSLTGHTKKITSLKFVDQNGFLITGSADKTVRMWQGSEDGNYSCIHIFKDHTAEVEAVTVHPSRKYFATTSKDNSWRFYDISTRSCLIQVTEASRQGGYTSAAFHPDGLILGTGSTDVLVKIWDVKTQSKVASFGGHAGPVTAMSFSENGYFLATAALDGVKLWDLRKFECFRTLSPYNLNTTTNAVEFDFSGSYLAIGGSDIRVYQVASPKVEWNVIKTLPDLSGTGKVTSIKFGADATYMAVGSMDQNLRIFGSQSYTEKVFDRMSLY